MRAARRRDSADAPRAGGGDGAHDVARDRARFYGAALRLLPYAATRQRIRLLVPMAHALSSCGQLAAARNAFAEAIDVLATQGDESLGDLVASAALMDHLIGDPQRAERRIVAALEHASVEARPFLHLLLAVNAIVRHDVVAAATWLERAAADITGPSQGMLQAGHDIVEGLVRIWSGRSADALFETADHLLVQTDDTQLARRMELGWYVGGAFFETERLPSAAGVFRRLLRLAGETRQEHLLPQCNVVLALTLLWMLDLDAALSHAETAEEVARLHDADQQIALALTARGLVLLELASAPKLSAPLSRATSSTLACLRASSSPAAARATPRSAGPTIHSGSCTGSRRRLICTAARPASCCASSSRRPSRWVATTMRSAGSTRPRTALSGWGCR